MKTELGFAIIGCGNIAPFHAKSIQKTKGARLVVVGDTISKNAERVGKEFQVQWTNDMDTILSDPRVEVISIATPSGLHRDIAVAGARAGKHLVVEKPLEITLEKCDDIIRAARENMVKLSVIFPSRFKDGAKALKTAIERKRFGRIALADAYVKWYRSEEYYKSGAWRGTWALDGGGALMNQSIHTVDLLQWLMGEVESVEAYTATTTHEIEVEDNACAILKFKNGALGVIEGSTSCYPGSDDQIAIHGEKGTAVLVAGKIKEWKFKEPEPSDDTVRATGDVVSSGASDPTASLSHEYHKRQFEDMVEAIRKDIEPLVTGQEGRKAVRIISAIYESSRKGVEVKLETLASPA
jgi:UDP-N-acetyl-2-amino-2-deoxyglucuronate dehydrogenase